MLDANILIANFRAGHAFKLLIDGARTGQLQLVVPEIAIREAANKFEERCTEERRALDRALAALSRIGAQLPSVQEVAPRAERVRYEQKLRKLLKEAQARTPKLSAVSHEELVDRALQRRKPFKENGAGYRDALLWATVLEESRTADVLLFTRDKGDFQVDGQLAPSLAEDAKKLGGGPESIELRTDLGAFVDEVVSVEAVAIDAVRRALPAAQQDLEPFVRRVLFDADFDRSELRRIVDDASELVSAEMVGERVEVGDAQVLTVREVRGARVERAEALSTGDVIAELYVEADVELDVEVDVIGHDARTGRPRIASCFAPTTATLGVDLDATFIDDDLALSEVAFYGVTLHPPD